MAAPTELTFTQTTEGPHTYHDGKIENFSVSSDTEIDVRVMKHRKFGRNLLLQLTNSHATNGLIVRIFGSADNTVLPPDFATGKYTFLKGSNITILAGDGESFALSDTWVWILIRTTRHISGNESTLNVFAHGVE